MIKTVEIVSLSSGIIGESFAAHELKIGVKRLESMGLRVRFSKNALKEIEYIKNHPEDRASDLLNAYADPDVDMILCAIGGDEYSVLIPLGTDVFMWYYDVLDTRIENERAKKHEDAAFVGISTEECESELRKHGLEFAKIK